MITASSICSSIRMKVLGQAEPLTVTERPLDSASAIREEVFGIIGSSGTIDSWSGERPREDNGGSVEEWRFEERMKVADTEVISRTERRSICFVCLVGGMKLYNTCVI